MPKYNSAIITALALLFNFAVTPVAAAQDEERWYQVELLIFSHEGASGGNERFKSTPALAYPKAARFLVEPDLVEANIQRHKDRGVVESDVDEYGRQVITILPPEDEETASKPATDTTSEQDPNTAMATIGPAAVDELEELLTPTPFVVLPGSAREFYGKAVYMKRLGEYDILFHQSWLQPVVGEKQALPLLIDRSGDTQEWPRLQGSIKLYLSRYLHLHTNLWLNTSGNYLAGQWRMPAPSLGPPSLIVDDSLMLEEEDDFYYVGTAEPALDDSLAEDPLIEDPLLEEETGPVSPWRHAVLLQQKRRMRSSEIHYVDHPLFGLVIKLTPVDEEALHTMALQEQDPS